MSYHNECDSCGFWCVEAIHFDKKSFCSTECVNQYKKDKEANQKIKGKH